jgi:ribose transport system substrate-binding protein
MAAAAAAAAALLAVAACSSSPAATTSSAKTTASSGVRHAQAAVSAAETPLKSYPVPDKPLSGVSSLRGKTIYYIPITEQSPQFAITAAALKQALSAAGLHLQECNGNSNPASISACFNQAIGASAGGIITDSIPYVLAANAFSAALAKHIPVLITDQVPDPAHPAGNGLAYLEGAGPEQLLAVANWIIANSDGKAKVLIDESTDSPSTIAYVAGAQKEFKTYCPGCTVTINKISSANFALIPSSTSSALLRTPKVDYVVSEFDQYLEPILGGVQQSGKAASVRGVSAAATLSGLQMLAKKSFLYADVGQASAYQGWASADSIMRMMLHQPVQINTIPIRIFTRANVGSVALTTAAADSGAWFGPATYQAQFKKLWGVG